MQFSCGQCSTRYAVPDDKVRGKRIRTKCRKCGAEIVVEGASLAGEAPASSAAPAAAAASYRPTPHAGTAAPGRSEDPWTIAISRSDQRKMITSEVVEAYAAGTITDTTLVWKQGMQKWQPPFDIPAIALALLARGLEPKPKVLDQRAKTEPPPPAASTAADWEDEATRVFDAAVVAEDLVAPKARPASAAPKVAPPKPAAAKPAAAKPAAPKPNAASAGWDDEDEATKMFTPDRALLGRRLPKAAAKPPPADKSSKVESPPKAPMFPPPGSPKTRPPPVPPRRSTPPAARSVRPPAPLTPTPTQDIGDTSDDKPNVPTVRPPPGTDTENPFSFEDEATAVITADRAKALLEEQLTAGDKSKAPAGDETPMAFGTDAESPDARKSPAAKPAVEDAAAAPPKKRESMRSYGDLVEKGPTVVVAESERRSSSAPPPARSPLPLPPPPKPPPPSGPASGRDFGGIQHERTRVIRARKKPGGPLFWMALAVALGGAAVAGYYASRLLDGTHQTEPEQK